MAGLAGAMGGWWFFSSVGLPADLPLILRVEVADTLAEAGGLIAEVRFTPGDSVFSGVWTAIAYSIHLRYQSSSVVDLVSLTPIPDPALGHATSGVPRNVWAAPWRFALVFQCSSWDGSAYAADGAVQLFMNGAGTPLLSASAVTIPRRVGAGYGNGLRYSVAANGDCDRVWARTTAAVLPTTAEGAATGSLPTDVVFFEDFTGGVYPQWTPVELYPGLTPTPNVWPDCGGDDGWGISSYVAGPSSGTGGAGVPAPYAGLWRAAAATPPPPTTLGRIRRLRRAPHLSAEQVEQFFARFQLDLEAGVGNAADPGADPQVYLRWSDDGGHTWRAPLAVSAGTVGAFRRRALWRRLGRSRDRVFEVSMSDPVKWALLAASLDAAKGTS